MDTTDFQRRSINGQISYDVGKTVHGEQSLAVRASVDVAETSVWSKWYEGHSDKHVEAWIQPALDANLETQKVFQDMKLSHDERQTLDKLETIHHLVAHVKGMAKEHQDGTSKRGFQQVMANIESFAKTYGCIVDALKEAPPFGAGHVAFGLFAIAMDAAARKHKKEQMIREFLAHIFNALPRLSAYGELYPTKRMVLQFAQLYSKLLKFLRETFIYYRKLDREGSLFRMRSSMEIKDTLQVLVYEISQISSEIYCEGMIGLSSELRRTRENTEVIRNQMESTKAELRGVNLQLESSVAELEEVNLQLKSTNAQLERANLQLEESDAKLEDLRHSTFEAGKLKDQEDVERLKHCFVHPSYDTKALFAHTTEQIRCMHRNTKQKHKCDVALRNPKVLAWRDASWEECDGGHEPKIIWLTSEKHDITISHVALELVESFTHSSSRNSGPTPIFLHSLYHVEKHSTTLPQSKRTACTLLKEAIFQLIQQVPSLLRENSKLQALCRRNSTPGMLVPRGEQGPYSIEWEDMNMSLGDLGQLMKELLDTYQNSTTTTNQPFNIPKFNRSYSVPNALPSNRPALLPPARPIFWVIDRIDTCIFKERPKHIEPALRPVYQNAPELRKFADVLEKLVSSPRRRNSYSGHLDMAAEGGSGGSGGGGLRVLMTSIYGPGHMDQEFIRNDYWDDEYSGGGGRRDMWDELLV